MLGHCSRLYFVKDENYQDFSKTILKIGLPKGLIH